VRFANYVALMQFSKVALSAQEGVEVLVGVETARSATTPKWSLAQTPPTVPSKMRQQAQVHDSIRLHLLLDDGENARVCRTRILAPAAF
jgi:hypothetical protein